MAQEPIVSWERLTEVYDASQVSGAASKLVTSTSILETDSIPFVLRIAASLNSKPKGPGSPRQTTRFVNPFLPPDKDLFVGGLSPTHTLVLNKFNVVEHHSLVITREYESQNEPLNANDLEATGLALSLYPEGAVAFYNCGPASGRSQPHKHLQIVPLPFDPALPQCPLSRLILDHPSASGPDFPTPPVAPPAGTLLELRSLPFRAYAVRLASLEASELNAAFQLLYQVVQEQCPPTPLAHEKPGPPLDGLPPAAPPPRVSYNALVVDDRKAAGIAYMALFPRRAERYGILGVNSLGFAGTLLLRGEGEERFVREEGALRVLQGVGVPW